MAEIKRITKQCTDGRRQNDNLGCPGVKRDIQRSTIIRLVLLNTQMLHFGTSASLDGTVKNSPVCHERQV